MAKSAKLVKNKYEQSSWEAYYSGERLIHIPPKRGLFVSYDIFLCDSILQKYLPKYQGSSAHAPKICELGSGDGKLLKKISGMMGYKPYGVEYSLQAAKMAKKNGINTIVADAFDKKFLKKYKNFFDIVYSYGFIEHILPPEKAIKIHLDILRQGGLLVLQIPRFRGFNLLKVKFFRPELIPLHNLAIMDGDVLQKICKKLEIQEIYCSNYGTLKLRLPMEMKNIRYYILKFISLLDYILNPTFRLLFRDKGFETNYFSPAVIFIGKKKK